MLHFLCLSPSPKKVFFLLLYDVYGICLVYSEEYLSCCLYISYVLTVSPKNINFIIVLSNRAQRTEVTDMRETRTQFWVVVPCIWSEIRINYQLDAIEYLFT